MIPVFKWKKPNIHPLPGAVWMHRSRPTQNASWEASVARTDCPKARIKSTPGSQGYGRMEREYCPPKGRGLYWKFRQAVERSGGALKKTMKPVRFKV